MIQHLDAIVNLSAVAFEVCSEVPGFFRLAKGKAVPCPSARPGASMLETRFQPVRNCSAVGDMV
jgi:hypothetical protein